MDKQLTAQEREYVESETKLLPCPFCGEDGVVEANSFGDWLAYCSNPECELGRETGYIKSETKAISTWNTRAPDPAAERYVAGAAYRELMAAAQAHVNALEACEPAISNAFGFSAIHGGNYTGPTYGKELTALKAALAALPAQDAELEKEK